MVHHGERYMQNFISSYDQDYIRNYHSGIRRWDRHRIMWTPEKSDHPLTGKLHFFYGYQFFFLLLGIKAGGSTLYNIYSVDP